MSFENSVKRRIEATVKNAVKTYEENNQIELPYGDAVIGYASVYHPFFDTLYRMGLCSHPKEIYRSGQTAVIYFIPYNEEVTESNRGGDQISELWKKTYTASIMLPPSINGQLRQSLDEIGRITSGAPTTADWNRETFSSSWNHKFAAYLAGMGEFNTAGSFVTAQGFAGCFGGIFSDLVFEPTKEWNEKELTTEKLEGILHDIRSRQQFSDHNPIVPVSDEKIKACPCGAISSDGIDRAKCQTYCDTLGMNIPCPEVCGKCFY